MTPYFFAMDRPNYSRWLPVYLSDMNMLSESHPDVHQEFMRGEHSICRSTKPFSKVWTDMALEQSLNRDSKTIGGIVGISQRASALERWFLTNHQRASITSALKDMCNLQDDDHIGSHREGSCKRIERDEEDVQKLLATFESKLITNPFILVDNDEIISPIVNISTGIVLPPDPANRLLTCHDIGLTQMKQFVEKRLNTNEAHFFDPIPKNKIQTFSSMTKKRTMKSIDDKKHVI